MTAAGVRRFGFRGVSLHGTPQTYGAGPRTGVGSVWRIARTNQHRPRSDSPGDPGDQAGLREAHPGAGKPLEAGRTGGPASPGLGAARRGASPGLGATRCRASPSCRAAGRGANPGAGRAARTCRGGRRRPERLQPGDLPDPSRRVPAIQHGSRVARHHRLPAPGRLPGRQQGFQSQRDRAVSVGQRRSAVLRPGHPGLRRRPGRNRRGLRLDSRAGSRPEPQGAALLLGYRVRELRARTRLGLRRPRARAADIPGIESSRRRYSSHLDCAPAGIPGAGRGDWQRRGVPLHRHVQQERLLDWNAVRADRRRHRHQPQLPGGRVAAELTEPGGRRLGARPRRAHRRHQHAVWRQHATSGASISSTSGRPTAIPPSATSSWLPSGCSAS